MPDLSVPKTYEWYRSDELTTDFSRPALLYDMLEELSAYIELGNQKSIQASVLMNMYKNTNEPFSNSQLNQLDNATYSLSNNIFGNGEKGTKNDNGNTSEYFEQLFNEIATNSQEFNSIAEDGKAGVIGDGSGLYLLNPNGFETKQLIEIGLMSAVFQHQSCNVWLSNESMYQDNTNQIKGKKYTALEHNWDESFGFLELPTDLNNDNLDGLRFWSNMAFQLNGELEIGYDWLDKMHRAYRTGRANISQYYAIEDEADYSRRDESIEIIKSEWEILMAACALHELNNCIAKFDKTPLKHHYASRAYAYLNGLKYTSNGANNATINTALNEFGLNVWTISKDDLNVLKLLIIQKYPVLAAAADRL